MHKQSSVKVRRLACFAAALVLTLFVGACAGSSAPRSPVLAGQTGLAKGVSYEYLGDYTVDRLNAIMTTEVAQFSTFRITYPPARNAVSLYRVLYDTVVPERGNKPVVASGLVAIPKTGATRMPVVSYQHGTVFSRTEAPSNIEQTLETRLMVARFAGQGYIIVAADNVGKGVSNEPDSYFAKDCMAQACLDMLTASRAVCSALGVEQGDLFLSGWSQGSWTTHVFRYRLESLGIPVKATATACTPTDIYLMFTGFINNPSAIDAVWLPGIFAQFLNSYEIHYHLDGLSRSAIKPQYWQTARDFYDNKIGWAEASKVFPATVNEMLQPEFAAMSSLLANDFYRRLRENQAYQWRFLTPTRYYYGKIDEAIRPYVGTLPVDYQKTIGGAPSQAVYAGDVADHRGTFLFGVLDQKDWFDSLLTSRQSAATSSKGR